LFLVKSKRVFFAATEVTNTRDNADLRRESKNYGDFARALTATLAVVELRSPQHIGVEPADLAPTLPWLAVD
jgi:hypothetical protein